MGGVCIHMGHGRRLPRCAGRRYSRRLRSRPRGGMSGQSGGSTGRHTRLSLHPGAQRPEGEARAFIVRAGLLEQRQYPLRVGSGGAGQRVVLEQRRIGKGLLHAGSQGELVPA